MFNKRIKIKELLAQEPAGQQVTVMGWTFTGYLSKDKAIMINFGLQIPLFMIGYFKIFGF